MAKKRTVAARHKKVKAKKVNVFEKRVDELDRLVPFRTCKVCGREGRDLKMIGPSHFRCGCCGPGSPNWLDWFETAPSNEKTDFMQRLYNHHRKIVN